MASETKSNGECIEDVSKCDVIIRITDTLKHYHSNQDNDKFQIYNSNMESDYCHMFQHHQTQKEAILLFVASQIQLDKCELFNCLYIDRCLEPLETDHYYYHHDDDNYRHHVIDAFHCWLYHINDTLDLSCNDHDLLYDSDDSQYDEQNMYNISDIVKGRIREIISDSVFNKMDYGLSKYYQSLNKEYYINEKPKFSNYLYDNGYTKQNIDDQLDIHPEKNVLVNFDNNFPFHSRVKIKNELDQKSKILMILKHIRKYGCLPNVNISAYEVSSKNPGFDALARLILMGVYDDNNIWFQLGGMRYIVKHIWEMAKQFNQQYMNKDGVAFKSFTVDNFRYNYNVLPEPTCDTQYIDINMMPFYMERVFEQTKLPKYVKRYFELIRFIYDRDFTQSGKVCYLTIQESLVQKGKTQRRPGLHVESPGSMILKRDELSDLDPKKDFIFSDNADLKGYIGRWGTGDNDGKGGVYMVSNINNSCAAWNCTVENEVIGHLGDIEHLRGSLPNNKKTLLEANKLYWMTDRTPHEPLPMKQDEYRIFFRVVTHQLSFWYEQHCTPNPNGVVPDPEITRIIRVSKFSN